MTPIDFKLTYNPIILPLILSVIISLWLGFYALTRRRNQQADLFALLMVLLSVWTTCYIFGLSSVSLSGKIFWLRTKYIGSVTTPIIWLIYSAYFTRKDHLITKGVKSFLITYCVVTLAVVFTSDYHGWMWQAVWIDPALPEEEVIHGFYFWVYVVVTYLAVITSSIMYFYYFFVSPKLYKKQALVMAISSILPWLVSFGLTFLDFDLIPLLDDSIVFFLFTGFLFSYALFKLDVLNILPIAHEVVLKNMGVGVVVLDTQSRLLEANPSATKLLNINNNEMVGKPIGDILQILPNIDLGREIVEDIEVNTKDNQKAYYEVRVNHIFKGKELIGYIILLTNITEKKKAEIELTRISILDPLTNLINRRHFFVLAERELSRSKRHGLVFSLIMFDLDHFKAINDTYGHLFGDDVLCTISRYCRNILRKEDIFARFGGDEFICLLPETDEDQALQVAEKLLKCVEDLKFSTDQGDLNITISLGVTQYRNHNENLTFKDFLDQADKALMNSKQAGRNVVSII